MKSNLIRLGPIAVLIGCALLAAGVNTRTYGRAEVSDRGEIEVTSFHWGITQQQMLRVCLSNRAESPRHSTLELENVSLVFSKIVTGSGDEILVRELRVPAGQSRCTDFSYGEMVAAGLDPEPTDRIQFQVIFSAPASAGRTVTVGGAQAITVGAVQSINIETGKTEQYQSFRTSQTRQISIIQDL